MPRSWASPGRGTAARVTHSAVAESSAEFAVQRQAQKEDATVTVSSTRRDRGARALLRPVRQGQVSGELSAGTPAPPEAECPPAVKSPDFLQCRSLAKGKDGVSVQNHARTRESLP